LKSSLISNVCHSAEEMTFAEFFLIGHIMS